jgi:trehalose 6-phosphate synthase/phosphatase
VSARVLIVSNRAPVTARVEEGALQLERSAGGLATGLAGPHEQSGGLWIGWSGLPSDLEEEHREALAGRLAVLNIVPVPLGADEVERYYEGVCNGILWPLFHYFVGRLPLQLRDFPMYEEINQRFADTVAAHHRPGDLIWVHDYQLMLVPALLRQRIPDARIGFFLHIPFPSSEIFRTLPYREALLRGLLGADLIGFHTAAYMRHFSSSVLRVLGISTEVDRAQWEGRAVRLGVFPMGVDAAGLGRTATDPAVEEQVARLRAGGGDQQLLVGIDRLDYTKGIPRRLLAFERLLEDHPDLRERVRLVQVSVPSRTNVEAYQDFREQMDGLIGRIHGTFATPSWTPIHYMFRGISEPEVVALYRAADAMVVTPIRDGMNLVAKEFIAARSDEDGVLVLSEFAGAANELAEAIHVNPYDTEGMAAAYYRALTMPPRERRLRMRALRRRVAVYDVHRWARSFLEQLAHTPAPVESARFSSPAAVAAAAARLRAADHLVLLLDYDGTLVPLAETPDLAIPDEPVLSLVRRLTARAGTDVHVVSGRPRDTLERWLGDLAIWLHAEHGAWTRAPGATEWTALVVPEGRWRPAVLAILEDFAGRTPGSIVEEKTVSLAWHYRMAEPEYGLSQANELKLHLSTLLSNEPVEILLGDHVIEVRPHGLHKGRIVPSIVSALPAGGVIAAFGDDRTDEDLFAALPPGALAIHVGAGRSATTIRLADVSAVRRFLASLLDSA